MSLRPRLARTLELVHLIASATLIRSILFDRWITVLASVLLVVAVAAARRGKTWGVGLALASAAAFPMAWVLGMAPAWFLVVGAVGALPFALTARSLARFDAKATAFGASLAVTGGVLGAVGWWVFAPAIISMFPSLRPGYWPAHEVAAALTTLALSLVGRANRRAGAGDLAESEGDDAHAYAPPAPARIAASPGVRVLDAPRAAGGADLAPAAADELDEDPLSPPEARARRA
ncbi:MAG TPA: hypothetical protein VFS43_43305 [Polyangiaceae bacterium]|nr:hypothetical protein [Polyangiaceae bacterium]